MIVPEVLFQHVVREGLRDARENRNLVYQLFSSTPVELIDQFYESLISRDINFRLEWPREEIELPIIWLNLASESEEESFLGEIMGFSHGADGNVLPDGHVYPYIGASGSTFFDSSLAQSGEATELGGDSLYVGTAYDHGEETSTTVQGHPVVGEPAKVFDVSQEAGGVDYNNDVLLEKAGQGYRANYILTVLGDDPTYTIFLYVLLKSIINRARPTLEFNGARDISMSGTDFAGDPELLPAHVYSRSIQVSFVYFADYVYEPTDPVSQDLVRRVRGLDIVLDVVADQEVVDTINVVNSIVSITSVTPNTGAQGSTVSVLLAGTNIHQGALVTFSGTGITLSNLQYVAGNSLSFDVEIDASATLGARDVTVVNPNLLYATLTGGFTVTT